MSLKSSALGPEQGVGEQKCPGYLWKKGATIQSQPASQPCLPQMRAGHRVDGRVFLEPLGKIGSDFTLEVSQEPDQCQA